MESNTLEMNIPQLAYTPNRLVINGAVYEREYTKDDEAAEESRPFQIGDFVRVVRDTIDRCDSPSLEGKAGKVVHIADKQELPVGVEFPEEIRGHHCGGTAAFQHGWYFASKHLEHID